VQTRDALALAVVLVVGAAAVAVLSLQGGGGGMMGGMGGMMGGMALAGLLVFVAIAFLVVALVARPTAGMPPPVAVPPPAPVMPASPPSPAVSPSSAVEAAVVKLLDEDERLLYTRLRDAGAPVLQKDVVAWGTFSAAKVTRLLDRLETKGLVVRERYGMTNRIRLAYR
jgi:uncharacterized membrane protein